MLISIEHKERVCYFYNTNEPCWQYHNLMTSQEPQLVINRKQLNNKLTAKNPKWKSPSHREQF